MTDSKDKSSVSSTPSSALSNDPHQLREAEKYENPIPSREFLIDYLSQGGSPMTHPQLAEVLGLTDEDSVEALRRRLFAMTRDGQVVCNRNEQYLPVTKANLLKGRVIGHPDGYGFVKTDEPGNDLVLSERQMRGVFDGDRAGHR